MKRIGLGEIRKFVKEHIQAFHTDRLRSLEKTELKDLLKRKNPYLFKAKNTTTANELVTTLLDAKLSSSEEEIFGGFLENLAIFVAQKTMGAAKSSSHGIDIEYTKRGNRYLVAVKSGVNWGNSSQWKALENDFKTAMKILRQSAHVKELRPIVGICYGRAKTTVKKGFILQVTGQTFWYMISGDGEFYRKIVEPLGHKAKELNEEFAVKKARLINKFTGEFVKEFCDKDGKICWDDVVQFNSKNLTKDDEKDLK